jgi:hypothetical protein
MNADCSSELKRSEPGVSNSVSSDSSWLINRKASYDVGYEPMMGEFCYWKSRVEKKEMNGFFHGVFTPDIHLYSDPRSWLRMAP